jgi:hypothetical protein
VETGALVFAPQHHLLVALLMSVAVSAAVDGKPAARVRPFLRIRPYVFTAKTKS